MSASKKIKSGINPEFSVKTRKVKDVSYYLNGLQNKNRFILSECITLLESTNVAKRAMAGKILDSVIYPTDKSVRIGITGSPGVGKSTFIEAFGMFLISKGHFPAILTIDPSSQTNKGSILGDKTRMQKLASHQQAFVRPTPSGNVLGGTAEYTKETIHLCEAAGFDFILVETVGVGQSESEVDNITDINILLLQPGAGDDIQGIKRGIMENADIFIINKADGRQLELAKQTKAAYNNAIQLFHHDVKSWTCPVLLVSSIENKGMDKVYEHVSSFILLLKDLNQFDKKRLLQEQKWFEKQTLKSLQHIIFKNKVVANKYFSLSDKIRKSGLSSRAAIQKMEDIFISLLKNKT